MVAKPHDFQASIPFRQILDGPLQGREMGHRPLGPPVQMTSPPRSIPNFPAVRERVQGTSRGRSLSPEVLGRSGPVFSLLIALALL